jgi:F420-non-reducing hydrogenase iron-sulfur subunit
MPPTLRVVRVMCSGSLDPEIVLSGLKAGSDGVIIMGCHLGDCHYLSGNYETLRKYDMMKRMLALSDFNEDRLHLEWVSASEGIRFQQVITEFTEKISKLGPSPIRNKDDNAEKLKAQIDAISHAASQFRLRSVVGREKKITDIGNAYGENYPIEDWEKVKDQIFEDEYIRSNIILNVSDKPKTVEEISEAIGFPTEVVFHHVARLWKKQVILPSGHKELSPMYVLAGGE